MGLAAAVPPLGAAGRGVDEVGAAAAEADVEDLAGVAAARVPPVGFAGRTREAGLVAFFGGGDAVVGDGPVFALGVGGDGVGVPAAFHGGGGDGAEGGGGGVAGWEGQVTWVGDEKEGGERYLRSVFVTRGWVYSWSV